MKTSKNQEATLFRPLMDWWVAVIVVVVILALGSGILMVLWWTSIDRAAAIITALVLAAAMIFFIDIGFYSVYILDDEGLTISSHIRHVHFAYRNMRSLQPGGLGALFSIPTRKRFALSRKNVIIKLVNSPWKAISVSPVARDSFVNTILERIDDERSKRAARQGHPNSTHTLS